VNKTLGEALLELAGDHPDVDFLVLAGHTHGRREFQAAPNLMVRVGEARYGRRPRFVRLEV
jgi:hypothetical protein